jgi:hypothetical protein
MLSEHEAAEIERGRARNVGGPIVLKWVDQLLADRKERIAQLEHLRQRIAQAFRYLDGLTRNAPKPTDRAPRPPTSSKAPPVCAKCGKPYVTARGVSPQGVRYAHADGSECVT